MPSPPESRGEATRYLQALAAGDEGARDRLLRIAYEDLRAQAGAYLSRERGGHTLQPTALVHEAWVRLIHEGEVAPESRSHFLALAARAMRQVLVDHARAHRRDKRGGGWQRVELHPDIHAADAEEEGLALNVLALEQGLEELRRQSPRKAEIVELRFYGGLTKEETAEALGISRNTVGREWRVARAWLAAWLGERREP